MKVIDLFIEYTKDTVQPGKVKFRSKEYTYTGDSVLYNLIKDYEENIIFYLNEEVEIIEEDKEIEKINSIKVPTISNSREKNIENIEETLNKYWFVINKLTEAVNELKKGK